MIRSYPRSAKARIEGSIEVGSPGSTSRRKMPSSSLARLTPSQAAALKDLSSLPPMSKTMPTRSLPPDSSRLPMTLVQAGSARAAISKRTNAIRLDIRFLVLLQLRKHSVPSSRFFSRFVTCNRPINHKRLAIDQSTRHRAPEPAIEALISVIPKHEILVVVVPAIVVGVIDAAQLAVTLNLVRDRVAFKRNFERFSHTVPPGEVTSKRASTK